jgi:hypothetical protein
MTTTEVNELVEKEYGLNAKEQENIIRKVHEGIELNWNETQAYRCIYNNILRSDPNTEFRIKEQL